MSRESSIGTSILLANTFNLDLLNTINYLDLFKEASEVYTDPSDFFAILFYYFSNVKRHTPLPLYLSDAELLMAVALYINKMHSEEGMEVADLVGTKEMGRLELLFLQNYNINVLPSLLCTSDIFHIKEACTRAQPSLFVPGVMFSNLDLSDANCKRQKTEDLLCEEVYHF